MVGHKIGEFIISKQKVVNKKKLRDLAKKKAALRSKRARQLKISKKKKK